MRQTVHVCVCVGGDAGQQDAPCVEWREPSWLLLLLLLSQYRAAGNGRHIRMRVHTRLQLLLLLQVLHWCRRQGRLLGLVCCSVRLLQCRRECSIS